MGRGTSAEVAARNAEVAAYITAHPEMTYTEIGRVFGVSLSWVSRVAARYNLRRDDDKRHSRGHMTGRKATEDVPGYDQPHAASQCHLCTILTDQIDEGVAIVRIGNEEKRACQDCVQRHGMHVVRWERAPVEITPLERTRVAGDIATARWPILEEML